ncbi:jg15375 [Pararge aegeria aegeria]|uniref:Jg15375 protein n=1 Tax=Pararge aegeria aegeria TaxID=348720 RepID=A0A8S4S7N3_9NEOP|nr:jg15375 [Pararge aegeria aegeria]
MFTKKIKNGIIYVEKFFVPGNLNIGAFVLEKILAHKDRVALVVDRETDKVVVGEPGEVQISGPTVVVEGYIGKDKKDDFDEEGYYKTGDIAYYYEEGYFFIVDRIKEIIKYKAWQVPPSELEGLLQHPAVKEAGVIGAPDILAGELPTAFVVKQPGFQVTKQEIAEYINKQVAPWKRLRGGVIFVNEIPKTPSGKILRRKLLALLSK